MAKYDLSILIPSRNEMFLANTIENILENIEGNTEIITVLDGAWADPPIKDDPRVTIIHHTESIGQRAGTNEAARLSKAKYVMKVDAHCAFDKGFDVKMISEMHDDWTMVPLMKNLHAFDWVCEAGHRRYQGPSGPCLVCGKETKRDILWKPKEKPNSTSYCFDSTPHFQYFNEYTKRPEGQGDITETMSLQGSCWMLTRDKYWELNVCDENFGSWGSQGIEVAAKTWLSGGKVMVNKKTWYAHMFRTQGGDFGFPYPISRKDQEKAQTFARDLFFNNKWEKQIYPLSWLIEKFWPVKGWTEEDLAKLKAKTFQFSGPISDATPVESEPEEDEIIETEEKALTHEEKQLYPEPTKKEPTKEIIYFTDNHLRLDISHNVQEILKDISLAKKIPIISVSLKPMPNFGKNVHIPLESGPLTLYKQILAGLQTSTADIVFLCEHDVLYHPSHFDFTPPKNDVYYYNTNVWKVRPDGHCVHYDVQQTSGLCAYRDLLISHYKQRIQKIEEGLGNHPHREAEKYISMMFEPGTRVKPEDVDDFKAENWQSEFPIVDIRHGNNLTAKEDKWSLEEFSDKNQAQGWKESDEVPGWGSFRNFEKRNTFSKKLNTPIKLTPKSDYTNVTSSDDLLSVIIPSRNEKYLSKTVDDIFAKAKSNIEVVVILDENDQELAPRPNLIVKKKVGKPGLRSAMNQAIDVANGKYIMKADAHCMFGEGFDEVLKADCEDNWVVIPRRYSLDPETWTIKHHRPVIDYEYFVFPFVPEVHSVKTGGKWYQRAIDRAELMLDEDMAFQGSCWFTTKKHLKNIDGFSIETSTGDEFVCESEELANKTWLTGGKVMVNKRTWYAHWHKGSAGRGYFITSKSMKRQRKFHNDYWMNDKWPKAIYKMEWFVERFWPIPGWPEDWKDPKYQEEYKRSNGIE